MEPICIAIVGMPASGKTEATYILQETYAIGLVRLSVVVRDELKTRNLEENYENLEVVARDLRQEFGEDIVIRRAAGLLAKMGRSVCCIDGVRSLSEIAALKQMFPNLITLAIHASPGLRYRRTNRLPPSITPEQFVRRDRQNLVLGVGEVIALADYLVVHDENSRAKFKNTLGRVLRKISDAHNCPWPPLESRHRSEE